MQDLLLEKKFLLADSIEYTINFSSLIKEFQHEYNTLRIIATDFGDALIQMNKELFGLEITKHADSIFLKFNIHNKGSYFKNIYIKLAQIELRRFLLNKTSKRSYAIIYNTSIFDCCNSYS